ncbi:MAG: FG-GAP repeat protein [Planctomycetota bacterium]
MNATYTINHRCGHLRVLVLHAVIVLHMAAGLAGAQCWTRLEGRDRASGDCFAESVSLSGDLAIIGAWGDDDGGNSSGSAWMLRFDGTEWVELAKHAGGGELEEFGRSVSVSGDVAVVGAPTALSFGSAYVYRWNGCQWVHEQRLRASDGQQGDRFGEAVVVGQDLLEPVVIRQDLVVVSAPRAGDDAGAAYVFRFDGSGWNEEQKLVPSDIASGDRFSSSLAVDGELIVAGASAKAGFTGAAYVFRRNKAGLWVEEQRLLPNDPELGDRFGSAVAVQGDVAIVGASKEDEACGGGDCNAGCAYVFGYQRLGWVQQQKLMASDAGPGDQFGGRLSMEENTLLVGVPVDDASCGSVYLFGWDGSAWVEKDKITVRDGGTGDFFGMGLCVSNNRALVGAPGERSTTGAAYLFRVDGVGASWKNYGEGWPGTRGIPGIALDTDLVLGRSTQLDVDNSLGSQTAAVLLLGSSPALWDTPLGGSLLVAPSLALAISLPASGLSVVADIPCDEGLEGLSLFMQVLEADPGASAGVSFTPGLWLLMGSH